MNLLYNKSEVGLELITNSLKNLDQLDEIFTKSEIRIIKKAKRLIKQRQTKYKQLDFTIQITYDFKRNFFKFIQVRGGTVFIY